MWFYHWIIHPNDADGFANSIDSACPDLIVQTFNDHYGTYKPGHEKNVSYVICKQQRRRSACASAQSDQRLCFRCLDSIISLDSIADISRL